MGPINCHFPEFQEFQSLFGTSLHVWNGLNWSCFCFFLNFKRGKIKFGGFRALVEDRLWVDCKALLTPFVLIKDCLVSPNWGTLGLLPWDYRIGHLALKQVTYWGFPLWSKRRFEMWKTCRLGITNLSHTSCQLLPGWCQNWVKISCPSKLHQDSAGKLERGNGRNSNPFGGDNCLHLRPSLKTMGCAGFMMLWWNPCIPRC